MVPLGLEEDLGLVHQPAEGLGVDDAVHIPLIAGTNLAGLHGPLPAPGLRRQGCVGGQMLAFQLFGELSQGHGLSLPFFP